MPRFNYNYKELLLKNEELQAWYDNLRHGSKITADERLRRIGYVCRVYDTTTDKLATMTAKEAYSLVIRIINDLERQNKSYEYMKGYVKALKSWFSHNGIIITQKIRIPENHVPTKVSQEQSPTPDQFRRVLNAADLKQKVECTLVGLAGLREETVGNYTGQDGLKVNDLPEIQIDHGKHKVSFSKIPTLLIVRPALSKAGHQYFTFYPEEGCDYLKELLEFRMSRLKEKITPETPIITSIKIRRVKHITTINIGDSMRTPIRKAGFDWRPYILRTYFDTRMMMAEADRLIIRDWRTFWMGHKGDIEHVYTLNKGRLPDDLIEQMRKAFAKAADQHLATTGKRSADTKDLVKAQTYKTFLELAHLTQEEIDKLGDLSKLEALEIDRIMEEKQKSRLGLKGNSQKVIPMGEVEQFISEGWEFVKELPPNKAIIRLPK